MNGNENVPVNQGVNVNTVNNSNTTVVPNSSAVPVIVQTVPAVNTPVASDLQPVAAANGVQPTVSANSTGTTVGVPTNFVTSSSTSVNPTMATTVQPTTLPINNGTVPVQNVNFAPANFSSNHLVDAKEQTDVPYNGASKFKLFMMIFLFIALVGFVLYLPNIATMINQYKSGENASKTEVITTGKLKCFKEYDKEEFTVSYHVSFKFTDSQLKSMEYEVVTKGDASQDGEKLKEEEAKCRQLSQNVEGLDGIYVRCNGFSDHLEETQSFDLAVVDVESFRAAFVEAGLISPEYRYNQNIDQVEKDMNASAYDCNRE